MGQVVSVGLGGGTVGQVSGTSGTSRWESGTSCTTVTRRWDSGTS